MILRRQFLRGAGGLVLALPFLPSLAPRALAATGAGPKRVFFIRLGQGQLAAHWYPQASRVGFQQVATDVREMPLANLSGPISHVLSDAFDPIRDKLLLIRGLDGTVMTDHNKDFMLTGASLKVPLPLAERSESIDQVIARHVYEHEPLVRVLNLWLGYEKGSLSHRIDPTTGDIVEAPALRDPRAAWTTLFGKVAAPSEGLIVDKVREHYQALTQDPRLSASDRAALSAYFDELTSIQKRLAQGSEATCGRPTQPAKYALDDGSRGNVEGAVKAMLDLMVVAAKCDLTRVTTFSLKPEDTLGFLGVNGDIHALSHFEPGPMPQLFSQAMRWHCDMVAAFLARLAGEPDPLDGEGKSLLDNSLVFLSSECGTNQSGTSEGTIDAPTMDNQGVHYAFDMPVLLAGGAGGLRMGRYLNYLTPMTRSRFNGYVGRGYNELLVSIMLAMGLKPAQWELGGKAGFGDLRGFGDESLQPIAQIPRGDYRSLLVGLRDT